MLYMGRLIHRKGVQLASQVSKELGKTLVIAGQGDLASLGLHNEKHIVNLGAVGPEKRAELMGKAICSFAPTYYIEPFGGVAVEAMMCGTPVLTTDWGAYTETVNHGVSGWRCRTFDDFLFAATQCPSMNHNAIREYAIKNYSCDRIGQMYNEYFNKIYDLKDKGYYQQHPERTELNWLCRY
jgi:glycosyltransferase involved in cell wall biosynthesis